MSTLSNTQIEAENRGCPSGKAPIEIDANQFAIDPSAFVKKLDDIFSLDVLVRGAKCGGCLSKIENGIGAIQGVENVRMNLTTGRLRVSWKSLNLNPSEILAKITSLGYGATPFDPDEAQNQHSKTEKQLLLALAVAGFAAANIMLLSVSVWSGVGEMNSETREFLHWLSAIIAIPAVAFSGRPFFTSALNAMRAGHVNMDVPISLAVFLSIGMSLFETINHGTQTYFDAAVMLLFFLLIGRFLDAKLQREAQSAARDLALMQAVSVPRLTAQGIAESVKATELIPGNMIQIAPGERFAVDAEIISGESDLDTRMVTGESLPMPSKSGDIVYAGTINITKAIIARVKSTTDDSMLAEVSKLLDTGEQKKSKYRKIADKAASLYVPIVHTVAFAAFVGWMLYNGDLKNAIFIAIAILIITCPCALALAAPVVQVVAIGKLFKQNVFLKSGDALERIAACNYIVFDKTGTLTRPETVLEDDKTYSASLTSAALLARGSRHPFSRALALKAGPGPIASDLEEIAGCGVQGLIDGKTAKLGSAKWINGTTTETASDSSLYFSIEGQQPVKFNFAESIVTGTCELVEELNRRGIQVEVLSGDCRERVENFAQRSQIQSWLSGVTPIQKAARINDLEAEGNIVLMIGDGLNDAGAIANAHASLTPGGAVDISRAASDGVFSGEDVRVLLDIIDVAHQSKSRMLENFGFAALYNIVAIPFAVLGFITPLVAAIAMSGSSLVVTLNALRLNLNKSTRKT